MHFQASLPRLPIPKLSETCQRYLAAQRPILNDNEYSITNELTLEFSTDNSQGWELNKQLIQNDKDNKHTSFISNYWFDMYLKDRRSIVLNHNPFMTFNADPRNPSQTDRASQIIWSAVRFHNSLRDNLLKPEVFHLNPSKSDKEWFDYFRYIPSSIAWYGPLLVKAFPLDMSQYGRLFGSTRIPRQLKDELTTSNDSRHVIIMKNDNMYMLNVMEPNGEPVDINHIYASLEAIKADSGPLVTHPISMLPTLDRDSWTAAREELVIDTHNAHQLELLDSALFVMSLDDSQPTEAIEATKVCLHNYGYNRWVDKSIQFIVCENASTAVSFEHAWGDGVAVLRLFNEVYDETTKRPRPLTPPTSPASLPEKLSFNLSDGVKKAIDKGRERLKEKADSLSVNLLQFEKFGKNYLKSKKLSPDAVIQLAFQIAYYRQYNTSPSTYESCSTAAFRHGRTETIRPASIHTMNCAKSFQHDSGKCIWLVPLQYRHIW
jgi:carnitine O-palmitoyltransferase 2